MRKNRLPPGFETENEAENRRLKLADQHLSGAMQNVAACSTSESCGLDICAVCLREFRKQLVRSAQKLLLPTGTWTAVCIVPADQLYGLGRLTQADLRQIVHAFRKRLERSPFSDAIVIGGLDLSYNTHDNDPIGWQVHFHILVNRPCSDRLRKEIITSFKLCTVSHRPLKLTPVKPGEFLSALTYVYKPTFYRRSQYRGHGRPRADGSPGLRVRDQSLTTKQRDELLSWLAYQPVGMRLILRNTRRTNASGGKLRLKLLTDLVVDDESVVEPERRSGDRVHPHKP